MALYNKSHGKRSEDLVKVPGCFEYVEPQAVHMDGTEGPGAILGLATSVIKKQSRWSVVAQDGGLTGFGLACLDSGQT